MAEWSLGERKRPGEEIEIREGVKKGNERRTGREGCV